MAERETRRQRQERTREEARLRQKQATGRQRWQRGFVAAGAALIIATGTGIGIHQYLQTQEQVQINNEKRFTDLGLEIDENGFWKAVNSGPSFGVISKNIMDCLKPLGDFCVSNRAANFEISLNRPMLDFISGQADLLNPSIPTRMQFIEDWVGDDKEGPVGAFTTTTDDRSEQIIFVSLKAAALSAFRNLEKNNLPVQDYFDGAISFFTSTFSVHEFAHAGAETKRFIKSGEPIPSNDFFELVHPQVFAFQDRYTNLYIEAQDRNLGEKAIMFKVLFKGTDIEAYKQQIFTEARAKGIE